MLFLRVTEVQTVFSSLQATNVQNGLITVYEKSITPPLINVRSELNTLEGKGAK